VYSFAKHQILAINLNSVTNITDLIFELIMFLYRVKETMVPITRLQLLLFQLLLLLLLLMMLQHLDHFLHILLLLLQCVFYEHLDLLLQWLQQLHFKHCLQCHLTLLYHHQHLHFDMQGVNLLLLQLMLHFFQFLVLVKKKLCIIVQLLL